MDDLLLSAPQSAAQRKRYADLACAVLAAAGLASSAAYAQSDTALLRCYVTYAGSTQEVRTYPVEDPYTVPRTGIGERFAFKPVVVGQGRRVDYVALYVYRDTRQGPILIQEAKYHPPWPHADGPLLLTGQQYLYAGAQERELMYHCTLQGHQP